jgi:hypothetical protein
MAEKKHESIAAALAAFQADLPGVGKDSVNPHFKSKYADLADMSKAILPALARQGLAFVSLPTMDEHVGFALQYALIHESGGKLEGLYPLPAGGNEQQKGSAITYARRYCLGAVTGVAADEDDDGNAASQAKQPQPPDGWRAGIAGAETVDSLGLIHQQATREGWATQDVMKALTARKKVLLDASAGAGSDSQ